MVIGLTHTGVCKSVLQLALSHSDDFLTTTAEGLNISVDVLQTASEKFYTSQSYLILSDKILVVLTVVPPHMIPKVGYCNGTGRVSAGLLLLGLLHLHTQPHIPLSPLSRKLLNAMSWKVKYNTFQNPSTTIE